MKTYIERVCVSFVHLTAALLCSLCSFSSMGSMCQLFRHYFYIRKQWTLQPFVWESALCCSSVSDLSQRLLETSVLSLCSSVSNLSSMIFMNKKTASGCVQFFSPSIFSLCSFVLLYHLAWQISHLLASFRLVASKTSLLSLSECSPLVLPLWYSFASHLCLPREGHMSSLS